eukprot:c4802_g1_i1.p2 GENE.c4802_g1_i1~~c4802_g1_i1.p2  ORF type:complete len:162 (+),score=23.06 c4802_g1_i1:70-555(+)
MDQADEQSEALFIDSQPGAGQGPTAGVGPNEIHAMSAMALTVGQRISVKMTSGTGAIGYLNVNQNGWIVLGAVAESGWAVSAAPGEPTKVYIRASGPNYADYYLSYNNNLYLGVYKGWADARYFSVQGKTLISDVGSTVSWAQNEPKFVYYGTSGYQLELE